jgi:ATP-dependent DNA helicase RecQ
MTVPHAEPDSVVKDPKRELHKRFGHKEFREGQFSCVNAALQGRDVFCLMPTGGGKSVIYQVGDLALFLLF